LAQFKGEKASSQARGVHMEQSTANQSHPLQTTSASNAIEKFSEFCERLRAEGYVKGFVGGLHQEYIENDHSLARVVGPVLGSAQQFLREHLSNQSVAIRYSCDSKHNSIQIAALVPEEMYLPKHGDIFEFLLLVESIIHDKIHQLDGYFLDSRTITFSETSPLDIRSVERDFPFFAE
jgi:hypothetical protein